MAAGDPKQRKRTRVLQTRCAEKDAAAIRQKADSAGLSVSTLLRCAALDLPPPPSARRPPADLQAVARLLAALPGIKSELGKHGSNLNQIAHHLNAGRPSDRVAGMLETALEEVTRFYDRDLAELRLALLQALGREPDRQ